MPLNASAQLNQDDRPYDGKLLRLSEILGAVHYLRERCGANEGQVWRDRMKEIIDSEGTTAIRRAKLVKGFNKGYRGYRRTYRSCTEPAKVAIDRFMEEGATLADLILKENQ
ncbi:MAG TPA: TIGR02301 family protein [Rhizobiales bacterium]|nr:TIGR02301 family protein [Hyphomicrobiales bacterium]